MRVVTPGPGDSSTSPDGEVARIRLKSSEPETLDGVLDRLARSSFRAKFHLSPSDARYARSHGRDVIAQHAERVIGERLAAANPENDGRQTPMRGHPVFRAQHATATCCRGCLAKHHGIVKHHPLTVEHRSYVVAVIMRWIERELSQTPAAPAPTRPSTRRASAGVGARLF